MAKCRKSSYCQHQNTHPSALVYPHNNCGHQPVLAVLEIRVVETTVIILPILPYNTTQWPSLAHTNIPLISPELPCEKTNKMQVSRSTKVWAADAPGHVGLYQFTAEVHTVSVDPTAVWELENYWIFLPNGVHFMWGLNVWDKHKILVHFVPVTLLGSSKECGPHECCWNTWGLIFTCHTESLFQNSV